MVQRSSDWYVFDALTLNRWTATTESKKMAKGAGLWNPISDIYDSNAERENLIETTLLNDTFILEKVDPKSPSSSLLSTCFSSSSFVLQTHSFKKKSIHKKMISVSRSRKDEKTLSHTHLKSWINGHFGYNNCKFMIFQLFVHSFILFVWFVRLFLLGRRSRLSMRHAKEWR